MSEAHLMRLHVDFKSGRPVYLQLMEQVDAAASSGSLRPGEPLPEIAALAAELRVNRNAIVRAWSELERIGTLEMIPSKGYFLSQHHRPLRKVAQRSAFVVEERRREVSRIATLEALRLNVLCGGLVSGAFVALYAAGQVLLSSGMLSRSTVVVLATALPLGLLPMLRPRLKALLHNRSFLQRQRLVDSLRAIREQAQTEPSLDSLLECVAAEIGNAGLEPLLIGERTELLALLKSLPTLRAARSAVVAGADVMMPLYSEDEVLAVLQLPGRKDGREYSRDVLDFLAAVGEQVSIAASRFRLRGERSESEYALEIQRGLLPRQIPQVPGFTVASAWHPAKNVGGDYYDVFKISDTQLALLIADVAGKGIPAALLVSTLQATTKAYASIESSPAALCDKVNRAICASISPGRFITFFYGLLDWQTRRFVYVNAGHNPPLLISQQGECRKLEAGGPVLGIFADACYEQREVELRPGDRLAMFTDGITEAANTKEEEFGEERLIDLLTNAKVEPAENLRATVMREVTTFCDEQFSDDATLLVIAADASKAAGAP
jgi:serine phosphatase RsbU (regulator of sigma subunit)/DNA-binding transcriptional regulator YhcF (GntR family)